MSPYSMDSVCRYFWFCCGNMLDFLWLIPFGMFVLFYPTHFPYNLDSFSPARCWVASFHILPPIGWGFFVYRCDFPNSVWTPPPQISKFLENVCYYQHFRWQLARSLFLLLLPLHGPQFPTCGNFLFFYCIGEPFSHRPVVSRRCTFCLIEIDYARTFRTQKLAPPGVFRPHAFVFGRFLICFWNCFFAIAVFFLWVFL